MSKPVQDLLQPVAEPVLPGNETELDRPMSSLSVKGDAELGVPPSMNELRLGERVLDLERQNQALIVRIHILPCTHIGTGSER